MRSLSVAEPTYRAVRVFNNNAVLARQGEYETVLVGRGIGFGVRAGDTITAARAQRRFVAMESEKARYLELVEKLDQGLFDAISEAIDLASDLLGELHPSLYLMLTDHLAFAVQRQREGHQIQNPLLYEIKAVFPEEYTAALLVLQFINSRLKMNLPTDEIGFITLYLNGARRGETVKTPLHKANTLAAIVALVEAKIDRSIGVGPAHDELVRMIAELGARIEGKNFRQNQAEHSIRRDLPQETALAGRILKNLFGTEKIPRQARGEVVNLAVFLHGWRQDLEKETTLSGAESGETTPP